jgi:3-hydroxyisobutyrate dehydrogenase-like beta-hydroxyacid dehydrogenase
VTVPRRIGFLGAGQLGERMVEKLLTGGHRVLVYARRAETRSRLAANGAVLADSVADLARCSDVLIGCLFSDAQLRETGFGPDGFVANARPGSIFVSHTTGTLATLERLQQTSANGFVFLDGPVSGTVDDINAGTLTVLLGGPADAVAAVTPILTAYAHPVVPTGTLGSGLAIKLINNLLFSVNAQMLAAATDLSERLGVESDALLAALQVCSARSHVSEHAYRVGGMERFADLAGPFLRKDVAAVREAAAQAGVDLGPLGAALRTGPLALDSEGTS